MADLPHSPDECPCCRQRAALESFGKAQEALREGVRRMGEILEEARAQERAQQPHDQPSDNLNP